MGKTLKITFFSYVNEKMVVKITMMRIIYYDNDRI